MMPLRHSGVLLLLPVLTLVTPGTAHAEIQTYLSLGDSIAYGVTDFPPLIPSFATEGYVGPFANHLDAANGSNSLNIINLSLPGETTSSVFTGQGRVTGLGTVGGPISDLIPLLNLNYVNPLDPFAELKTQNELLVETIASELGAGHQITTVTISLGSNDLFALALSPAFQNAGLAGKMALLAGALNTAEEQYETLLMRLEELIPQASLSLLGTYNPYAILPVDPFGGFADPAIRGLNDKISGLAEEYDARYVDLYTAFIGNEATHTLIIDQPGNPHPNELGYALIAEQLTAVPEPGSLVLLSTGAAFGIVAIGRKALRAGRRAA